MIIIILLVLVLFVLLLLLLLLLLILLLLILLILSLLVLLYPCYSEKLAANVTRLTLEFLEECIQGCRNSSIEMKHLCLEYMTPWLPNLTK